MTYFFFLTKTFLIKLKAVVWTFPTFLWGKYLKSLLFTLHCLQARKGVCA